jgi:hypothetical protein
MKVENAIKVEYLQTTSVVNPSVPAMLPGAFLRTYVRFVAHDAE